MDADSDEEILEFAISREIEAYNFYMSLAERVAAEPMRKIFKDLAGEELQHKAKLELEVIKLGKVLPAQREISPPDHKYIISNDDGKLDIDYKDMLMLGIEKEEASFRLYIGLLGSVRSERCREMLMALAEEEVKHKIRFENEYDALLENR